MKVSKMVDGEIIFIDPKKERLRFICCDCGATHFFDMEIDKDIINIVFEKDKRATSQFRRNKWGYLHQGLGKWKLNESK